MPYVSNQKDRDKAVILNVVRNLGPISRIEIHQLTKLRNSTISQLTRELLDDDALVVAGLSDNPLGRKQILLRLNHDRGFVLGIEFDADVALAAVMDLQPRIRSVVKEETTLSGGLEGLLAQLKRCARRAVDQAGIAPDSLRGIGVADIGLVNRRTGTSVMTSQIPFWRDVPIARILGEEFGVQVWVDNATRCRGNAERLLGSGDSADDMVYIEYGAGIGSALFVAGRVLEGHRTSAGEFGHTHVVDSSTLCQCGSVGCLEAIASVSSLATRFRNLYREGMRSLAVGLAGGEPSRVTGWHVLNASREGDKIASGIVEEMVRHLGVGLANLVNLLDPEVIVIDQRLEAAGPDFLDQLTRVVRLQALAHLTGGLDVRFGKLGDDAGLLGAGLLVLEELFAIPELKPVRVAIDEEPVSSPS